MKIGIVGVGAMGSVYAGLLADSGNEVWAVDRWREHVEAIRRDGLRVEGKSGNRTVRIHAVTDASEVGPCDLVIIATKAMHVDEAAVSAISLMGSETVVLTIQNGLGSAEKVAEILGENRVLLGVVGGFGASMKAPGHAHHHGMELVWLGERTGPVTPRLETVADLWRSAGFNVKTFDDIDQLVWEKLICNVCYSGTCAIAEMTIGGVLADPDAWRVASGCAAEAFAVAKARGTHLDFDDPVAYVRNFDSKIPNSRPSMLLDHLAGCASEVDAINGAIPPEGEKHGVLTPYNEVVASLIRAKEKRLGFR